MGKRSRLLTGVVVSALTVTALQGEAARAGGTHPTVARGEARAWERTMAPLLHWDGSRLPASRTIPFASHSATAERILGGPGVALPMPTTLRSTGAELHWSPLPRARQVRRYEVYRGTQPLFAPSQATLVASVGPTVRSFVDTSARPALAGAGREGLTCYYMVAARTAAGLIPGAVREVGLPAGGRTVRFVRGALAGTKAQFSPPALPPRSRVLDATVTTSTGRWNVRAALEAHVSRNDPRPVTVDLAGQIAARPSTLGWAGPGWAGTVASTASAAAAPMLTVTSTEPTAAATYAAPYTPSRMIPGDEYTVDVTVTNTTARTLTAVDYALSYRWMLPDGTDVTTGGNQLATALPADLAPGASVVVSARVRTPIQAADGNKRTAFLINWDLRNQTANTWLSDTDGIPPLTQSVTVESPTSTQLGLEKFYQYTGKTTGAGASVMDNDFSGNVVWSYNAFSHPSRGLATFVRLAYNSQDTSDGVAGFGWSVQASSVMRLGTPLDLHPRPDPTDVTLTDGDGTSHVFQRDATGQYTSPAGVHLYLQRLVACKQNDVNARAWVMTRPDRTQFFFDCDGYVTSVVDNNGNTIGFSYDERQSNNRPTKFLRALTDPTGRTTLTLDYYLKGDNYTFIDDNGVEQSASNLTNPHIIDKLRSITDIAGRRITSVYTDKGLLGKLTDGAGSAQPKVFRFTYDMTQGTNNIKLVRITDPRGHDTALAYYNPPEDPKFHWWLRDITDRLGATTHFAYTDPDGTAGSQIQTSITDPEGNQTTYLIDGFGRPVRMTNAKSQVTKLAWDADNNVVRMEENNAAVTTWSFDPKTGYPLSMKDAEANAHGTPGVTYSYQTGLNGRVADLIGKKTQEGRVWGFGYDPVGDLTSVTDPAGSATATDGDYTTRYAYDSAGQLLTATDANGHTTAYGDYDASGYPGTITDPLRKSTTTAYNSIGQVTKVVDALGKVITQNYDIFGRPLDKVVPKDQDGLQFITTPAPVYDANNNIAVATGPNGAVRTYQYDDADQMVAATDPKFTADGPERKTTYSYDKVGNLTSQTQPKGNLTADPADFVTRYAYDPIYELVAQTDAANGRTTYVYDDVGNVTTAVDARKNATADTADYTGKYGYDLNHRVIQAVDADGHATSKTYDRDGLVTSVADADGNTTLFTLDARGKTAEVKVPHSRDGDTVSYRVTRYEYDQVGNQTKEITPRGTATDVVDDFAKQTTYDELNRIKEQLTPFDPADPRYNKPDKTSYDYDPVGRLAKVSAPPSEGQTVRNDTTYTYFDNGWTKTSTDAWDIVTSYDYDALGDQTSRTLTSAGGSSSRTMSWTYYADGRSRSMTDDGVPVGKQVVLVDNSDSQNVAVSGAWSRTATGSGYQGFDYATHTADSGSDTFVWNLVIPESGSYEVFVRYPAVDGAATDASYKIDNGSGSATKTVDQTKNAGTWVSLGSFGFDADGSGQKVTLSTSAGGTVTADAVKLVRDNSADTDNELKKISYEYDPNGNQTKVVDNSPGARFDNYVLDYDVLNRPVSVAERNGDAVAQSTSYAYDENGSLVKRTHQTGQTVDQLTDIGYDARDLVSRVTNAESTSDPKPKLTTFEYDARAQINHEVKGNDNTVDFSYFLDGMISHQVEKKSDGTLVTEHTIDYDPNGNRSKEIEKKQNADDYSAYLNQTSIYTYDPLDRLARTDKTGDHPSTESYVHDAEDNVVSQTVDDVTTTSVFDRNRLQSSSSGGLTSTYNYDPFGRQDTVAIAGEVVDKLTYDGFDRIATDRKGVGAAATTTSFGYDPFDRTVTERVTGPTDKTTTFNYLGTTEDTLSEVVGGKTTKTYQYGLEGDRLSQVEVKDDGTKDPTYYSYNPRADVEAVTDDSGDTKSTYGYTAYGQDDKSQFSGLDKPDVQDPTKQPHNAYRFNAKRWDSAAGKYDMGFRDYDPGLNRFLTRDMYNGALTDMGLATDPFTGNRYAFGGGNPITNVELDGHFGWGSITHAFSQAADWVSDHSSEIIGTAVGIAVGIGCEAVTAGAGSIGCAALGGAVGSMVTYGLETPTDQWSLSGFAGAGLEGAVTGALFAGAGKIAGKGLKWAGGKVAGRLGRGADEVEDAAASARPGGAKPTETEPGGVKPTETEPAGAAPTCNCFPAGTKVATSDGPKPIERVKVGDRVWARDLATGKRHLQRVSGLFSKHADRLLTITAAGTAIQVTPQHPFWVPGRGWVQAGDLRTGDHLLRRDGHVVTVRGITSRRAAVTVYNFEVEGNHNYYVSPAQLLVHNCQVVRLKYGDNWTPEMRAAADAKVAALNEAAAKGNLVKTVPPKRIGNNPGRYRAQGNQIDSSTHDVDHIVDLQLGGADVVDNMNALFRGVNRSLGPQIANALRDLPLGTQISRVIIS